MLQKHHVNRMAAEGDGQGTLHKVRMLNSNFFITDHRIVITGEKPVTVSVCAITNYDVVIIKWCLKPGVASFILRHIVLSRRLDQRAPPTSPPWSSGRHQTCWSAGARAGVRQRVGRGRGRPKAASVLSARWRLGAVNTFIDISPLQ